MKEHPTKINPSTKAMRLEPYRSNAKANKTRPVMAMMTELTESETSDTASTGMIAAIK
jgi:hypothetical protein